MSHFLLMRVLMLLLTAASSAFGAWIGSTKDGTALGAVLGVFYIVGWTIILVMPARSKASVYSN